MFCCVITANVVNRTDWGQNMNRLLQLVACGLAAAALSACAGSTNLPPAPKASAPVTEGYLIGPGDTLRFFVWANPGLSDTVPVRPDGRVSIPLLEDIVVANKRPTDLAREVEKELVKYVEDPLVTVIVTNFVGSFQQQVRVLGEATEPQAIPYRINMSLLDVMIEVGGLTEFAAGNRALLVRTIDGNETQYAVRLDDLMRDGDISANVPMWPGDVLIVPESYF